ncbi:hypothetical protein MAR_026423 [Mya arenaria]|uniref:DUF1330 domain-containing protein n=1 Tax=Mya arenaria TaxID=6604 RepID=A0ABY7EQL2_MYAAR|nr:uncharacterized protein LOC128242216 [Mya arenaria]XP_052815261.1 uncharacterized protein LOC128242216 [Mya arenaria]WAR12243.1 hypothetical protein MAR_026423 [Mya arenaria]
MPGENSGRKSRSFATQTASARPPLSAREKGVQVNIFPAHPFPNTTEKASVTFAKQKQNMFPRFQPASKQVYLFIRAKKEYTQRLINAFVKEKKIRENYKGELLGIAEQIIRCEGDYYRGLPEQVFIVIRFDDQASAERWTRSTGVFKQKDLDDSEIFILPLNYLPDEDLRAFQLTELHGLMVDPAVFKQEYVDPVAKLMNAHRIYHGVAATHSITRVRNCMLRPDTYVLVNSAESEQKLMKDFYESADYQPLRHKLQRLVADNDTCFFKLVPLNEAGKHCQVDPSQLPYLS